MTNENFLKNGGNNIHTYHLMLVIFHSQLCLSFKLILYVYVVTTIHGHGKIYLSELLFTLIFL